VTGFVERERGRNDGDVTGFQLRTKLYIIQDNGQSGKTQSTKK